MEKHYLERIVKESPLIRVITTTIPEGGIKLKRRYKVEKLRLVDPIMTVEEAEKARKGRERIEATRQYPHTMEETEGSVEVGRRTRRERKKEEKMTKKHKKQQEQKQQQAGVEQSTAEKKSKGKYTDKSNPPKVEAGKQAIWHESYSYKNAKGTTITVVGHWEVIKKPEKQEKPKTSK